MFFKKIKNLTSRKFTKNYISKKEQQNILNKD